MIDYRLYPLDRDGRLRVPMILTCADDQEAVRTARAMIIDDERAELWSGTRLITALIRERPRTA